MASGRSSSEAAIRGWATRRGEMASALEEMRKTDPALAKRVDNMIKNADNMRAKAKGAMGEIHRGALLSDAGKHEAIAEKIITTHKGGVASGKIGDPVAFGQKRAELAAKGGMVKRR